jgi:hypothetical protein
LGDLTRGLTPRPLSTMSRIKRGKVVGG